MMAIIFHLSNHFFFATYIYIFSKIKVREKITYSQTGRVAYYYGNDDSFGAEDFGKVRL